MSFFGDIGDFVSNAASTVYDTAKDVVVDTGKVALGAGEGVLDTVGDVVKDPTELLNPFQLVKGFAGNLIHDIGGQFASNGGSAAPAASSSQAFGNLDSLGGSINDLQNQLMALDPKSPTYAADVTKLSIQLQQAQQQFSQIANILTNESKKADENAEAAISNLR